MAEKVLVPLAAAVIGAVATIVVPRLSNRAASRQQRIQKLTDLWSNLIDLKYAGEKLWDQADSFYLSAFATQLQATSIAVEKSSIFLREEDRMRLNEILARFRNFDVGKQRLIDLRLTGVGSEATAELIRQIIVGNRTNRLAYSDLMDSLQSYFSEEIRRLSN